MLEISYLSSAENLISLLNCVKMRLQHEAQITNMTQICFLTFVLLLEKFQASLTEIFVKDV